MNTTGLILVIGFASFIEVTRVNTVNNKPSCAPQMWAASSECNVGYVGNGNNNNNDSGCDRWDNVSFGRNPFASH